MTALDVLLFGLALFPALLVVAVILHDTVPPRKRERRRARAARHEASKRRVRFK